jgi:hypothetical protein
MERGAAETRSQKFESSSKPEEANKAALSLAHSFLSFDSGFGLLVSSMCQSVPFCGMVKAVVIHAAADYHRFAWLATFIGRPKRSMKPRAAVTS